MNTQTLTFRYSLQMLPVVVKALQDKRVGLSALLDFLPQAWADLEHQKEKYVARRAAGSQVTVSRMERLAVGRYFDISRRYLKAFRQSLELLESFLENGKEHILDKALRQFETGLRFQDAHLKARMNLAPMLCERLSRAC